MASPSSNSSAQPQVLPQTGGEPLAVRPFGKYYLVKKLAEGGMAEIFLAKQMGAEGFERNVVIKRMLAHLSEVPDFVGMFLDEARLAARLSHQNIIQINDLGLADGCYYICMEYAAGEDFSTVIRAASRKGEYVPLPVVLRVIADAAHGLHFAHEFCDEQGKPLNIVHRDVSPANLYVTYQGQVKVLDFGIAKAESRVTNTTAGVVKGKYVYMSPEQAKSGAVDRRSDVFSLGVSLYEALTNVRPFARENDLAILNAVLLGLVEPLRNHRPELPEELEAIVMKAISRDPDDRFQTAGEFAEAVERLLATNSASGVVSAYLRALFGEERHRSKTRIPSLANLSKSGADAPAPSAEPAVNGGEPRAPIERTIASKSMPVIELELAEGPKKLWLALGALAVVGALGAYFLLKPAPVALPEPKPVEVAAPAPVPAAIPDAGVALAQPPPAAPVVQPPPPPKPPEAVIPPKPVKLTAAAIQQVLQAKSGAISRCMEQNKADLPGDKGQLTVNFTIVSSGKVSVVSNDLDSKPVGQCVSQLLRATRFPAHTDKEISLSLPFGYEVKR